MTYAYELPDEKLLGLLSACTRTPHGVKKDIESELQVPVNGNQSGAHDFRGEAGYHYR